MSDITKQHFEPRSFDVIYSRDTILHIGDKEELFTNFFVSLTRQLNRINDMSVEIAIMNE